AGERMLEDAVAIGEGADLRAERHAAAGDEIDRVERLEALGELDAVGTDVLHRAGADGAGNQGQVLEPGQAFAKRELDKLVPALAGAGLDDPGVGTFLDQ